jgi:hypothetical protein
MHGLNSLGQLFFVETRGQHFHLKGFAMKARRRFRMNIFEEQHSNLVFRIRGFRHALQQRTQPVNGFH